MSSTAQTRRMAGVQPRQSLASRRALIGGGSAAIMSACGLGRSEQAHFTASGGPSPANLAFTSWWTETRGPWGVAMDREVLPAFARRWPEIKVHHVDSPSGAALLERLRTLIAGGTPPDVTLLTPTWLMSALATQKALVDYSTLIRKDERALNTGDFAEQALSGGRWAGKTYGLPVDFNVSLLYYNKRLFDAAGVRYPADSWTYENYLDAAKRLTGGEGATQVLGTNRPEAVPHMPVTWANGGQLYDKEFTRSLLDQPAALEAIQWIADLVWKHGAAPRPNDLPGLPEQQRWVTGRYAMLFHGVHFIGPTRVSGGTFDWDIALPPRGKVSRSGLVRMAVCCMLSGARHHDASWELVKHITSVEANRSWAITGGLMPARRSVANSDAFLQKPPDSIKKVIEAIPFSRLEEYHPKWPETDALFKESLRAVLDDNRQTARDAMVTLVPRLNAILRELR